jgi:hypothetical protein
MELLAFCLALVALAGLALRFGADSRPRAISPEEHYAQLGVVWDVTELQAVELRQAAARWRLAQHARPPAPRVRLGRPRRLLAGYLRAIASWLSAEQVETGTA